MINRELVFTSLINLVSSVAQFNTTSRRVKLWTDVPQIDMPFLGMLEQTERISQDTGQNAITKFYPELYIYVSVGNDLNANPYEQLNPILDSLQLLFKPKMGVQNLGGLVHSVKILGGIEKDGGILGPIAVAIIPLEIIAS